MTRVSQRIAAWVTALALSATLAGGALVASPTPASAQQNAAQFCKEIGVPSINDTLSEFFGIDVSITQGACVSALQAGNVTAAATSVCRNAVAQGFISANETSECIRGVKPILESFPCLCAPVHDDRDARELA